MEKRESIKIIEVFFFAAVGILLGITCFTFFYGKGFSYLSNDPKACMNCHVMREHYESWAKSSHHQAATCNECHIPHGFPEKYIAKFINGWNHSKAFTLQDFPEPIRITAYNKKNLLRNCLDCHGSLLAESLCSWDRSQEPVDCTRCHRSSGHMSLT